MARSVGSGQFFSSIPEARTLGSRGEPGRAGSSLKLVSSLLTRPTELTLLNSHSTLTAAPEAKRKAIGTCAQLFFFLSLPCLSFRFLPLFAPASTARPEGDGRQQHIM